MKLNINTGFSLTRVLIFARIAASSYSPAMDFTRPFLPSFKRAKRPLMGFVMLRAVDCVRERVWRGANASTEKAMEKSVTASVDTVENLINMPFSHWIIIESIEKKNENW